MFSTHVCVCGGGGANVSITRCKRISLSAAAVFKRSGKENGSKGGSRSL
jgi:hypothetical protein